MKEFVLHSKFQPTGDQPQAIEKLTEGIRDGLRTQVLLGVTGSGKTFTMANVIKNCGRPALVIAHNKTLAAQLCNEFREFFPENRVEFFVSYYDYYQPESYIPSTDTYIEKDLAINDEIDKLRHSATCSLAERRDVIVVASVSCIYGLGAPEEYYRLAVSIRPGMEMSPNELMRKLVSIQYARKDVDFTRSSFRVRGDTVDIFPSGNTEIVLRVEFFGDEVERVCEAEFVTGKVISELKHAVVFPASHYAVESEKLKNSLVAIEEDLNGEVAAFQAEGKLLEAQRLNQRTRYDIEMMREIGYCKGVENYSRYFDGRSPGEPPFTLLDYFPGDFLLFIDESHMTIPQIRAMYAGDLSRKTNLVNYGFRIRSAYDNRPLTFDEFDARVGQMVCVSATPAPYELEHAGQVVEQIIRPTGLLDPQIFVRPIEGQIDDLIGEINATTDKGERTLVTTLTKKMAEDLTKYLTENGIRVRYMHSDIGAMERMEIIRDLRMAKFDVLVGINLLREGLDLPEVSLIAILDADKEGFLRSETSLIQTIGRAARNAQGRVLLYADKITPAMRAAMDETARRRQIQDDYNQAHGIVPKTIVKSIRDLIEISASPTPERKGKNGVKMTRQELAREIEKLESQMRKAAHMMEYEYAAVLRDEIIRLRTEADKK